MYFNTELPLRGNLCAGDKIICSVVQRKHIHTWPSHSPGTITKVLTYRHPSKLQSRMLDALGLRNSQSSLHTGAELFSEALSLMEAFEETPSIP